MNRNMRLSRLLLAVALLLLSATPLLAWERLDQIVAVVGGKVILSSELEFQAQMYAVQSGFKIQNDEQLKQLEQELLRQMINDRLILIKAKQDTTIRVSNDEVDEAFKRRVDELQASFPTQAEFDRQLEAEGLTFRDLKVRLRAEVEDQLYKEKLISKLLSKVSVTRSEVENFFETYRDSLPEHPRSVKLARILLVPASSADMQDSLRREAESLLTRIGAGESFEELAKEYSDDISADQGGDIGTFNQGDLLPEFERAALTLAPGDVSGVVKTKLGYHIIKLVSKQGASFHCEHILLMDKPSGTDSTRVLQLGQSLVDSLHHGADWGELVKTYSDDETNKATLGELGWFAIADLPEAYRDKVAELAKDSVTAPFWADEGLQILKVVDRREARPFSLEEDWDVLKEYSRRQKSESVIAAVVDEMKDKVHLELRGL